jgi:hypothetical protein
LKWKEKADNSALKLTVEFFRHPGLPPKLTTASKQPFPKELNKLKKRLSLQNSLMTDLRHLTPLLKRNLKSSRV